MTAVERKPRVTERVRLVDEGGVLFDVVRVDRGLAGVRPSGQPGVTPLAWVLFSQIIYLDT